MFKFQAVLVLVALMAITAQNQQTEACKTYGGNGGNGVYHLRVTRSVVEGLEPKVEGDAVNPGPVAEVKSAVNANDAGTAPGHDGVVAPTATSKTAARK